MDNEIREEHESYGMLQIHRQTCSPAINLYGSSITHSNLISLSITTGTKTRNLLNDWYSNGKTIIEVIMSDTQFAEAITSLNMGNGVPVTLHRIQGKSIAPCPEESKRQLFEKEFEQDCRDVSNQLKEALKESEKILSGSGNLKKEDRQRLSNLLYKINQTIESNMPFVNEQFNKQIDKTVLEAKGECEAFFTNAINKLGIEALKDKKPELIGYEK